MNSPAVSARRFTLGELLKGFVAETDNGDAPIADLTLDSRSVIPGGLFLACQGIRHHGLAFAEQAVARGAAAIAWEPVKGVTPPALPIPLVAVENLGRNAGLIANRFFGLPSEQMAVTGVTGTNGKTSVSSFIAQALGAANVKCGVIGTLGAGFPGALQPGDYTTPDAVELHRQLAMLKGLGATAVAMEVSSHALDQGRAVAVNFDHAVFTNLSRDHLDYHGDMQAYGEAKRQLFDWAGLRAAIVNADDPFGRDLLDDVAGRVETTAYSVNGPVAGVGNLVAHALSANADGFRFTLEQGEERVPVTSRLLGVFNVQNILAAIGALLAHGMSLGEAVAAIADVEAVPGRMERFGGGDLPLVIVDYAHTPDALKQALIAARQHTSGKLIVVFGCGGDRDWGKRPFMGEIAERHADMHIITNDNPRGEDPQEIVTQIRAGLKSPRKMPVILDREEAIRAALNVAEAGDCVLVAGKGHEDYQIIGDERLPFSDREVVARLLADLGGAR